MFWEVHKEFSTKKTLNVMSYATPCNSVIIGAKGFNTTNIKEPVLNK